MINYEMIKQAAKEHGLSVRDLIVLAPQNDPFYVGTKGDIDKAEWFARLWERFGYTTGVHLRRVHYQLVSQDPPMIKPNGLLYKNTENDWSYLNLASKCARYLRLVDPGAFVDRRNPAPILIADYRGVPTPDYRVTGAWGGLYVDLPEFPELPEFEVSGYTVGNLQPYHLEVWVEKTTMNDVLEPLCRQYGVNLVTGAGELSITATLDLVQRVKQADRPCRIFYVSDFDPAGYGMPVSVARKIEFFLHERDLDLDIRLEPLALTRAQVTTFHLPRTPIKASERRRATFEDIHGEGAVELDALEALHPGELGRVVSAAILDYYDQDIAAAAAAQRRVLEEALEEARTEALSDLTPEIGSLQNELGNAVSAFEEASEGLQERLTKLHREIVSRLEGVQVDLSDYPLPEARTAEEDNGMLFDSERDYLVQLGYYQARRYGNSH
jgi:hypothetical protein